MTRNQFENGVCNFADLKDFCYECDCDLLEDVYSDGDINSILLEDIVNSINNMDFSWIDIRNYLDDIPRTSYWYRYNGCMEAVGIDNEFEDYKSDVYNWADDNDVFEDDNEDDEDFPMGVADMEPEESTEPPFDTYGISIHDFFEVCGDELTKILQQNQPKKREVSHTYVF